MASNRKPSGFWTKDSNVQALMQMCVRDEASVDDTAVALKDYCEELGVVQSLEEIRADVVWYARGTRKALGLPSVREIKQIAVAKEELAQ